MRGARPVCFAIRFALVFAGVSLSPTFANAQSKQEIRIQAGGEFQGDGLGVYGGVAYAPIRALSFGVVGSYAYTSSECDESADGDGCTLFASEYWINGEVEWDPFRHHRVDPFLAADFGAFAKYHDGARWGPSAGGSTGIHIFPADFISIDAGLKVIWVATPDDSGLFAGLFLGATPRIAF